MSRIEESCGAVVAERKEPGAAGHGERAVWPLTAARSSSERASRAPRDASVCCACIDAARPSAPSPVSTRIVLAARRAVRACVAGDEGAATAEYAIATMAAVAFAGLLVVILQSDEVRGMLLDLVRRALTYDR
ncbi:hypothetical protein BFL36_11110 [Clavibacter michiganensis]|uniref:DUF4244 domain-containing protein n=1 Tax=Clavibacter michiganensis TaxID=28447 RepID=A0A251Y9X6_9MICO|nr:hypothetical protein BFL36_11110 [Clavibacter michiganensis]